MKNPINIALIAIIIVLLGFTVYKNMGGSSTDGIAAGPVDASGFTIIDIEGTPIKKLEKYDENKTLIGSGETLNDLKTGTWTTYYADGRVKSINSYLAGQLNGVQVNFTDRGQVEFQAFYKNGQLNGPWATFNNGNRKKEERFYNMGKMNGVNRHYDRLGKLQKEISYKNDVQHGIFIQYDADGNVLLEYEYKNGEKVSGGIVKK
jgi:antitoxin component YwqK of YwqJK toxin-antitoxin module